MMLPTDPEDEEGTGSSLYRLSDSRVLENMSHTVMDVATTKVVKHPPRRRPPHVETPQMLTLGRYSLDEHGAAQPVRSVEDRLHHSVDHRRGDDVLAGSDGILLQHSDASAAPEDDALFHTLPKSSWLSRLVSRSPSTTTRKALVNNQSPISTEDDGANTSTLDSSTEYSEFKNQGETTTHTKQRDLKSQRDDTVQRSSPQRRRTALVHPFQGYGMTNVETQSSLDSSYTALGDETSHRDTDCSFFFRESDVAASAAHLHHSSSSPTMVRRNHRHQALYEYNDAVPVMARPALQQFRTKYAQLNQELVHPSGDRQSQYQAVLGASEPDPWDDMATLQSLYLQRIDSSLALSEEQANEHSPNRNSDHTSHHPYHAHGPIHESPYPTTPSYYVSSDLHRLPRDQVRLLMDPDLEAGILSVEQWRPGATETPTLDATTPPLRYVLTVSDDLYRSIVAEMSPTTTKYFCCPHACCNEEERADIRVAVYLLTIIIVILFINTMAFHED